MNFCIAQLWEHGLDKFDMLAPTGRHKTDWCRQETRVGDYCLPLTVNGRLYADLYQARLRPTLYRTWHNLPTAIRSVLTAFFVRI